MAYISNSAKVKTFDMKNIPFSKNLTQKIYRYIKKLDPASSLDLMAEGTKGFGPW